MGLVLSVNLGTSFADILCTENSKILSSQKFYLPQVSLSNAVKQVLKDQKKPIEQILVSSRFLEKILSTKLGGSVAQVVTAGFENWPLLRQSTVGTCFDLNPNRLDPLASQELIFGVKERVDFQGKVLEPLNIKDLEEVATKLKTMQMKKVCVNFLFANKNTSHQDQAVQYFREQGFDVFCAPRLAKTSDEIPSWRKNILNACLAGTFEEMQNELKKPFEGQSVPPILFLTENGSLVTPEPNSISSTMHGWTASALARAPEGYEVLYVGLENWWFVSNHRHHATWDSPWGLVEADLPSITKLRTQPTSEIKPDLFGSLQIAGDEVGYEPGPMCFGRAFRPTTFDILALEELIELPWIQDAGLKKYKTTLGTFIKNTEEFEGLSPDKLNKHLLERFWETVCLEILLSSYSNKIWLTGFFAPAFAEVLKKKLPDLEFELDPQAVWSQALGLSLKGQQNV